MSHSRVRPLRAVPSLGSTGPVGEAGAESEPLAPPPMEGQLQALLDHLPQQIGYWGVDLRNQLANRAYAESFGCTPELLRGRHLRDVIGEAAYTANEPYLQTVFEGLPKRFDHTSVDADRETTYRTEVHTPDTDGAGAIRGLFVVITDVSAQVKAEMALATAKRAIEQLAPVDELTGLASRRVLTERAELALAGLRRAQPGARCVGVLMLDLDGLGRVNEALGSQAGDEVLIEIGRRLTQVVRETDVVARLGGDEFVVLMPGLTRPGDATGLAHRIVALVNEPMDLPCYPAAPVQVSTSLGVAVGISGAADLSVQGLLREADRLMFGVKKQGGNRWARDSTAHVYEIPATVSALVPGAVPAPRTDSHPLDQPVS